MLLENNRVCGPTMLELVEAVRGSGTMSGDDSTESEREDPVDSNASGPFDPSFVDDGDTGREMDVVDDASSGAA